VIAILSLNFIVILSLNFRLQQKEEKMGWMDELLYATKSESMFLRCS